MTNVGIAINHKIGNRNVKNPLSVICTVYANSGGSRHLVWGGPQGAEWMRVGRIPLFAGAVSGEGVGLRRNFFVRVLSNTC